MAFPSWTEDEASHPFTVTWEGLTSARTYCPCCVPLRCPVPTCSAIQGDRTYQQGSADCVCVTIDGSGANGEALSFPVLQEICLRFCRGPGHLLREEKIEALKLLRKLQLQRRVSLLLSHIPPLRLQTEMLARSDSSIGVCFQSQGRGPFLSIIGYLVRAEHRGNVECFFSERPLCSRVSGSCQFIFQEPFSCL